MYQTAHGPRPIPDSPARGITRAEPKLLVAMPTMTDPTFRQSVILLAEHSLNGSLGFIINRPSKQKMGEILCNSGDRLPALLTTWYGGPVEPDTGVILHSQHELGTEEKLAEDLYIASSIDTLVELMRADEEHRHGPVVMTSGDEPPTLSPVVFQHKRIYQFRFLMGCAAWGPGQLEREMRLGQWLTVPYTDELLFNVPWQELWSVAVNSAGAAPHTLTPVTQRFLA